MRKRRGWRELELSERWKGVGCGVASAALYGLLAHLVRLKAGSIPASEVMFVRSLSAVVVFFPSAMRSARRLVAKEAIPLWGRSIAAEIALLCLTWNLQHTSVAFANALFNLAPLFVAVWVWRMSTAHGRGQTVLDAFLVIVGMFIFWTGSSMVLDTKVWGIGLLSACAASISAMTLKSAARTWNPSLLTWALSLVGIPLTLLAKSGTWLAPNPSNLSTFGLICALSLGAQVFLVMSFKRLEVTTATALGTSAVVWGIFFEVVTRQFSGVHGFVGSIIYLFGIGRLIQANGRQKPAEPEMQALSD